MTLNGGRRSTPRSDRYTPGKRTRCPLHRRLDVTQVRSIEAAEKSPPPTGVRTPNVSARNVMPALLKPVHNKNSDLIKTHDVYSKFLLRGENREVQEQRR